MIRNTLFLPLMAAAIGGPLLFFANEGDDQDESQEEKLDFAEIENVNLEESPKSFYEPNSNFGEIFNFGLTPAMVEGKFRKVTKTERDGFYLYRSSILSGHGDQDIVGAITYRFSFRNRLKSISFTGFASDPSRLVQFATAQFGFHPSSESGEYRPATFTSYSGVLRITKSLQYDGQFKIGFELER